MYIQKSIGDHIVFGDITKTPNSDIPYGADMVIGGFPCQGFSVANNKRSMEDKRNFLYKEMLKIIDDKFWGRKYEVNQHNICDYLKYRRNKSSWTTKAIDDHFSISFENLTLPPDLTGRITLAFLSAGTLILFFRSHISLYSA